LKKVTKTKIILMPTIVPEQLNCWLKTSNDIVFTGLLSWSENVNGLRWFLDEVWKELTVKHPNTKLRVVGQMADEKLISELQSIHNVIYHGYVKNLKHVYSKSRLAIAPIFINAGIKVKILTYLSYGIPTVAFKQTTWGMKEIGGVVIANKQNYASKITELLSDSKLCQKHSDYGYKNIMNNHSKLNLMQFFKSVGIT
ncbi:glycosyltransferase family 4 protein, partial [Candidatus Dojkabacteria bacterium]|nr:glycosyltransferase family 4 protein [Candidatus Dojkabacteria bacterium]